MSGVIKGIGKVFKAIWKVVRVVLPIVLVVAAVVFTAGAAIPALAGTVFAGGLGGAAAGVTASLGLTGTVGAAVTGAITYAGYGAAIGAATSAISGGDVLKGAQTGALTGAVTGGALGAVGAVAPAAPSFGTSGIPESITVTGPQGLTTAQSAASAAAGVPVAAPAAPAGAPAAGGGLLSKGGWLERNPQLAAGILQGIGGAFTPTRGEEDRALFEKYGANYAGGGGLLSRDDTAYINNLPNLRPPAEAFNPQQPSRVISSGAAYGFEYQWDPVQGKIVKTPIQAPQIPGAQ